MHRILLFCIGVIVTNILVSPASARVALCGDSSKTYTVYAVDDDYSYDYAFHTVGNLVLSVTNIGVWGESAYLWPDYITGETYYIGSEYPKRSQIHNLVFATYWIGGIKGRDTLVSTGMLNYPVIPHELNPEPSPFSDLTMRSINDPAAPGYEEAVSEQDIVAVYTDTVVLPFLEFQDWPEDTPHEPLFVEVRQETYAWSFDIADDFILFNVTIKNIGEETIQDAFFGVQSRPAVGFEFFAP